MKKILNKSILTNTILCFIITVISTLVFYYIFSLKIHTKIGQIVEDSIVKNILLFALLVIYLAQIFSMILMFYICLKSAKKLIKEYMKVYDIAYKNELTGFPSESKFKQDYTEIINKFQENMSYAYILVDFSQIREYFLLHNKNENDNLIINIGKLIAQNIKTTDRFAHHDKYEYQILYMYNNKNDIINLIETISISIKQITFNYGVFCLTDPITLDECSQLALKSLNDAKKQNKLFKFYSTENKEKDRKLKNKIEKDMSSALSNGEFCMYLQPKYNLIDNSICGAEALVRWKKSDGTIIYPGDFIKYFEENNFIIKMDLEILRQACEKIKYWINNGYKPIPISLNISNKYFLNKSFVNQIVNIVNQYNISHNLIEFDISETSVSLTVDKLLEINNNYEGKDFLISLEDSGEINSAISMLETMPANSIKLNQVFFSNAQYNAKVFDAIKNIISAFQRKNITVVAEGIETSDQVNLLKKLNCHVAQGYYFSKPLSAKDFDTLIYKNSDTTKSV